MIFAARNTILIAATLTFLLIALLLAARAGDVARTDWQVEVCLVGDAAAEARDRGNKACAIVDVGPDQTNLHRPPLTLAQCDKFRAGLINDGVWAGPCRKPGKGL